MPIYDYQCQQCHKEVSELLPMDHDDPVCCDEPMARLFSNSNFTFQVAFYDGYDLGLGRSFHSQRERDNYIKEREIRRI